MALFPTAAKAMLRQIGTEPPTSIMRLCMFLKTKLQKYCFKCKKSVFDTWYMLSCLIDRLLINLLGDV